MQEFYDQLVQERHYSFCIVKCADMACKFHKPQRLTATTEKDRPSLKQANSKETHQLPFNPSAQTAARVKRVVTCQECEKPRVLHSSKLLKKAEWPILDVALEELSYTCGSSMADFIESDDGDSGENILSRICVRRDLRCVQPVKIPYYSSGIFESVCCYCATKQDMITGVKIEGYYPICLACAADKPKLLRRKRKLM